MPRSTSARAGLQSSAEAAETVFYEALQAADVDMLMRVWADEDDLVCVHPGGPRIVGATAIRASFEQILSRGVLRITPERVLRTNTLSCAVHSVVEKVQMQADPGETKFAFVWPPTSISRPPTVGAWCCTTPVRARHTRWPRSSPPRSGCIDAPLRR